MRKSLVGGLCLVLVTALLGGCSIFSEPVPDAPPNTQTGQASESVTITPSTAPVDFGTANAGLSVMAQVTVSAGEAGMTIDEAGGTVTALLRSVEVSGTVLTISFALQWDDPTSPDDATASADALGLGLNTLMAIDTASMTGFRPFCTEGTYYGKAATDVLGAQRCMTSQLLSPNPEGGFAYPNHGLVEGFAVLPAPDGRPDTLDVALGEPFPMFTAATVSYR